MHDVSPMWIPIVAMLIPIVAIISGVASGIYYRRIKSEERLAMISRGIPLAEIDAYQKSDEPAEERVSRDPMRSVANARRAAIVLIAVGLGLILFSALLSIIVQQRNVLAIAAVGVIPLMIGIGFVVDYRMQRKDLARFGLLEEEKAQQWS